jgi:hypothetical protein
MTRGYHGRRPPRVPVRTGALALAIAASALALAAFASARPARAGLRAAAGSVGHLQVIEVEYRLMLSRGSVKAGAVGLEAIDRGADPHDLRLRRVGSGRELIVPQLNSGQRWDATVRLRPGTYRLWCSLPEHARLGMRAILRVR